VPLHRLLKSSAFAPEDIKVLSDAFEAALFALHTRPQSSILLKCRSSTPRSLRGHSQEFSWYIDNLVRAQEIVLL
jgi:hypothetical protein